MIKIASGIDVWQCECICRRIGNYISLFDGSAENEFNEKVIIHGRMGNIAIRE